MIAGFRIKRALGGIVECLDKERAVMLDGQLQDLAPLVEKREALVAGLEGIPGIDDPQFRPLIEDIQSRSKRNASLMEASMQGLRDGRAVLETIRETQARLGTYDAGGNVDPTTVVKPKHERRA